jgi:adenine-specific DNA-methyltransferase
VTFDRDANERANAANLTQEKVVPRGKAALRANGSRDARRRLAAFYTPAEVAQSLIKWAIRRADESVFDPSFGGCAFLEAAVSKLRSLGCAAPERQIYGVDLDRRALRSIVALTRGAETQFARTDFFALEKDVFGRRFDVIVGNPPYLRPTSLSKAARRRIDARLQALGLPLSKRASLWAPFVAYSTAFLVRGGRLAMVLPGALLHTEYGGTLLRWLTSRFGMLHLDIVRERLFSETDESSVILYGENYGSQTSGHSLRQVTSVSEPPIRQLRIVSEERPATLLVPPETRIRYETVASASDVSRLGDLASTRIGIVTGANDFFVLSESERTSAKIGEEFCQPVITKPRHISGLRLRPQDLGELRSKDLLSSLIVVPPRMASSYPSLRAWLSRGRLDNVPQRSHCRRRQVWYALQLPPQRPEAFLFPMGRDGPRIVINEARTWCTNNVFVLSARVYWPGIWEQIALGLMSSFAQLGAELVGRTYGGGILKVEPAEARLIAIPLLPVATAFSLCAQLDELLRAGARTRARQAVDDELCRAGIIPNASWNAVFWRAVSVLREARQPLRRQAPECGGSLSSRPLAIGLGSNNRQN